MKTIKTISTVFFAAFCAFLRAADFYVDAEADANSATGTSDAPYKTIRAAVDAANAQYLEDGLPGVINVKGGDYSIATADDLISVTASSLTIQAWAGTGTPKIVLDSELSVNSENPSIITVQSTALDCTIKGLEFQYFINNTKSRSGNSLGEKGRIIDVYAGRCSVDGCKFRQNDISTVAWGLHNDGIVSSRGEEGNHKVVGYELCVKNCYFSKVGRHNGRAIRSGTNAKIISNIFDDCAGYFYPIKQSIGGHFISNRVVNARASIFSNGQNYSEYNNMEIAYNIFVNAKREPFFQKSSAGMSSVKIHHNTIVGGRAFVATCSANKFQWTPSFYNNLIILPDSEDVVIAEEDANVGDVNPTTFKKGSVFRDNVWLAKDFNGGSAPLKLSQYKLIADSVDSVGLYVDNNRQISIAPEFIETEDVFSDDFYRLNLTRYPWAEGLNSSYDTTPAYIGAVEPKAIEAEAGAYFQIDNFAVEYDSLFAPVSATFSVSYSQNAGEVEVSWDFDGDGVVDQSGRQTSVTHVYEKPGDYSPIVRIRDEETNKEVEAILNSGVLQIRLKDVYVDSGAQINGNGSNENPFKFIREGVDACGIGGTVHIKGGEDRVYDILTEDDLIVVDRPNIKIKSWGDYGNPQFIISHELSKAVENPCVVSIDAEATDVIISDLNFVWYGNLNETYPGSSIGAGGRIISTSAERTLIKNCNFRIEGASKFSGIANNAFAVACAIGDNNTSPGEGLRVEGCMFEGLTGDARQMNAILCGRNVEVVQNVFTNCNKAFTYCKNAHDNHIGVVSNVFFECAKVPGASPWGPWNYTQNADISYNIFVTSTGEPFITKGNTGLNGNVSIHHNTVVGASEFMEISVSTDVLRPQIRDNLIILNEGGVVINDKSTAIPEGMTSAFKNETSFNNNVYFASAFSGGTATALTGYRMNVEPVNCTVLSAAPRFMSTDMNSPDFMRVKSKKGDWAYATAVGGYPNYVGAVEPLYRPNGMSIFIR